MPRIAIEFDPLLEAMMPHEMSSGMKMSPPSDLLLHSLEEMMSRWLERLEGVLIATRASSRSRTFGSNY